MPRANRYILPGLCYHITHRCHNKAFLLKFARDRDDYRERLRETLREVRVSVLSYTVTCNHVHLLLQADADSTEEVSRLLQLIQGQHAQGYNRRRNRHGAFWEDRFHATMIETGSHLWRCLVYIDLNMVRAGAVRHPCQWQWTGYHELLGRRLRYRVIDLDRLQSAVGARDLQEFRLHYHQSIEERLAQNLIDREPQWTESLAVGSRSFVEQVSGRLTDRQKFQIEPLEPAGVSWSLREDTLSYG